jgi:hypothetical protein
LAAHAPLPLGFKHLKLRLLCAVYGIHVGIVQRPPESNSLQGSEAQPMPILVKRVRIQGHASPARAGLPRIRCPLVSFVVHYPALSQLNQHEDV